MTERSFGLVLAKAPAVSRPMLARFNDDEDRVARLLDDGVRRRAEQPTLHRTTSMHAEHDQSSVNFVRETTKHHDGRNAEHGLRPRLATHAAQRAEGARGEHLASNILALKKPVRDPFLLTGCVAFPI
ncbi:MAG TPA: hypothetical protein VHC69_16280 [Polyangiaceae bacterium]|nr:hypothetical protein [Polyangiaceae bacterium]